MPFLGSSRGGRSLLVAAVALAVSIWFALSGVVAQDAAPKPYTPSENAAELTGTIVADGSSTVGPITEAVAEEFAAVASGVQVEVSISGTGGGFERFCNGETDLQDASRPIKDKEAAKCAEASVEFYKFEVAYDGIAIVVNPENDFVSCLTVDQLKLMWQPENPATNWNQIDPSFPDQPISLYGPGTSSGTFDYFTGEIVGEEGSSTTDYLPSEDDNQLVEGVAGDKNALGYFGLAYYEQNQDRLKLVAVDNGNGCVDPSTDTVRDLSYAPLSRPLYLYVNAASLQRPEVQEFMNFYLATASELAGDVGYVASPDDVYVGDQARLLAAIDGTGTPDSATSS
ncbi:MAG: PstS family phosphate ABC transporter substrate-binding protein [Thermomicrobiales bacterium]|nr:PstS family phosphate ABC transporter substrate-binding protein [Thermomicrobiales bacterium]